MHHESRKEAVHRIREEAARSTSRCGSCPRAARYPVGVAEYLPPRSRASAPCPARVAARWYGSDSGRIASTPDRSPRARAGRRPARRAAASRARAHEQHEAIMIAPNTKRYPDEYAMTVIHTASQTASRVRPVGEQAIDGEQRKRQRRRGAAPARAARRVSVCVLNANVRSGEHGGRPVTGPGEDQRVAGEGRQREPGEHQEVEDEHRRCRRATPAARREGPARSAVRRTPAYRCAG